MRGALKEKFAYFELQYLGMVRRMNERIAKGEEEVQSQSGKLKSEITRKKANSKTTSNFKKTRSLNFQNINFSTKSQSLGDPATIIRMFHNVSHFDEDLRPILQPRKTVPTNTSLFVPGAGCGCVDSGPGHVCGGVKNIENSGIYGNQRVNSNHEVYGHLKPGLKVPATREISKSLPITPNPGNRIKLTLPPNSGLNIVNK